MNIYFFRAKSIGNDTIIYFLLKFRNFHNKKCEILQFHDTLKSKVVPSRSAFVGTKARFF